jgi:methylated-DNA-[protein]-cysteine S-methyltransferase
LHTQKGKPVMNYIWKYKTPEGFDELVMCGDGEALTGLCFEGSRDDRRNAGECEICETPAFRDTCRWLDEYFAGRDPGFTPNYRIEGLTPFRQAVIDEMLRIPYGATVSYGDIAKAIERKRGGRVSAQAVGGAVGWNPICIVIPCHRVIGADGSLTGYGGGLGNKASLLAHEGG